MGAKIGAEYPPKSPTASLSPGMVLGHLGSSPGLPPIGCVTLSKILARCSSGCWSSSSSLRLWLFPLAYRICSILQKKLRNSVLNKTKVHFSHVKGVHRCADQDWYVSILASSETQTYYSFFDSQCLASILVILKIDKNCRRSCGQSHVSSQQQVGGKGKRATPPIIHLLLLVFPEVLDHTFVYISVRT